MIVLANVVSLRFRPVGKSFTGVTFSVIVLGLWSVLMFGKMPLPLSCTWNVNLALAGPLALAAGLNVSWLPLMLVTGTALAP